MNRRTRRELLLAAGTATVGVAAGTALAETAVGATTARSAGDVVREQAKITRLLQTPTIRGADLSFTLQVEEAGGVFRYDGQTAPVEQILANHGATHVRLRIWNDPPEGYSDQSAALTLAERARAAGLQLLIDPHYSDFWADPGKQNTPAAWEGQDLETLATSVYDYTNALVSAFTEQGTPIEMIQIGNEITNGMLWPTGQIYRDDGEHWTEFATLLDAGIQGARDGGGGQPPRIMIHIDRGGNNGDCQYFYDHILDNGVDFDVIGLSFYPFWHGSLSDLQANLADLAPRYGKDVVVAETSYPWTLEDGDSTGNLVTGTDQLPDDYPPTPEGQAAYLADLATTIADNSGLGFFVWEPEWLPLVGWEPGAGNPNDNLTLFDWDGNALPGIDVYGALEGTRSGARR